MPKQSKIRPEDLEAIAQRMRALRQTTGLSQDAFAKKVGLGYSQWANFEAAENRIGVDAALAVKRAMHVPLDWIYTGERAWVPSGLLEQIDDAIANPAPQRPKRGRDAA